MSANTSIEWTDRILSDWHVLEDQHVNHSRHLLWISDRVQPFLVIAVPLPAVAGLAGRHDVPGDSLATFRDRYDVIPGLGRLWTVGALTLEPFEARFATLWRDASHSPVSQVTTVLPVLSKRRIVSISLSLCFVQVFSTLAEWPDARLPGCASATPTHSAQLSNGARSPTGPFARLGLATGVARRCGAIGPRGVPTERSSWFPGLAPSAALLAHKHSPCVLRNRAASALCSDFHGSVGGLRHHAISSIGARARELPRSA